MGEDGRSAPFWPFGLFEPRLLLPGLDPGLVFTLFRGRDRVAVVVDDAAVVFALLCPCFGDVGANADAALLAVGVRSLLSPASDSSPLPSQDEAVPLSAVVPSAVVLLTLPPRRDVDVAPEEFLSPPTFLAPDEVVQLTTAVPEVDARRPAPTELSLPPPAALAPHFPYA